MGFTDDIRNMTQYTSSDSSFQTESNLYTKLNNLRRDLARETNEFEKGLNEQLINVEIHNLEKKYERAKKLNNDIFKIQVNLNNKYQQYLKKHNKQEDNEYYKKLEKRFKKAKDYLKKQYAYEEELIELREAQSDRQARRAGLKESLFGEGKTLKERFTALKEGGLDGLVSAISDLAKELDTQIDEIASYQSKINTRLQGSGKKWEGGFMGFGKGLSQTITSVAGLSPLITQQKMTENLNALVEKGIAYNIEQRAFLQTISDKIATTFDAANGTLLQLVRVQQSDTTAARLGLEGYLTRYLNKMFQTTEYLGSVANTVSGSLYEATSLLSGTEGVGLEAQVQKWLGSLYSVGMSEGGVQSIASALGMLGSGNISGLAGNQAMQNLLVMAASRSGGKSYAELLKQGLDGSEVNKLMRAMVEYLGEIANSSNNVIKSQYAQIFGMSISDLKSITNILSSIEDVSKAGVNYGGAMSELFAQAGQMYSRTSIGEMMSNLWENLLYSMSSGIASNPAMYALYKASNLLEATTGGIALPDIKYLGTGVNLRTTVADLMRVGALSGGILNSIGAMIGAGGSAGFVPSAMLKALGINTNTVSILSRGSGVGALGSGITTSESAYIGNASGSDVLEQTYAGAEDTKNEEAAKVKPEDEVTTKDLKKSIDSIYDLFDNIIDNINGLKVTVTNYNSPTPNPGGLN